MPKGSRVSRPGTKALYFIHGRGRGHASRAPAVYQALTTHGFQVQVFAGGDAEGQLGDIGIPFARRPPLLPSLTSLMHLARRTRGDVAAFRHDPPNLVVSDGDHAAILAARRCAIPSLAIGHDLIFSPSVDLPRLPRKALMTQRINSLPTLAAEQRIAVHFLPAYSRDPDLRVARPDVLPGDVTDDGSMLCYFRDDNGAQIASALSHHGFTVNWFTQQRLRVPGVNVLASSTEGFRAALQRCRAVVTSAGSNVLAECVAQHKPVLALHRTGDSEQQLNALLVAHAQVGIGSTFEDFAGPLDTFLGRVARSDFSRVEIHSCMPNLASVVGNALRDLFGDLQS
jgi:UDP-N-acetylglucosamine--N-acetylmuramyl-(pentapeptide) pyrophosphoryl-undecaprenol N-acetylglucosamine transferase